MGFHLKYPQWQLPLLESIIDGQEFAGVQSIIRERLGSPICDEELHALTDALDTIRDLKRRSSQLVV